MAKQVQFRRGTATENNAFTGAVGEISVDTTNKQLRVHDGSTAGGTAALAASAIGTTVQAHDADTAKTDVEQTFTAPQRGSITALTSATTITMDLDAANFYSVTLAHSATFANPTNTPSKRSIPASLARPKLAFIIAAIEVQIISDMINTITIAAILPAMPLVKCSSVKVSE